ncbi:MAG: aminoglycoside adenylyltransferase domain-containing protein [Chloroflexota bacterium]
MATKQAWREVLYNVTMRATEYSDINDLLDDLLSRMRAILGQRLVGLYLYGSLVWGDFDHDISDIDMLAATATDVNENEFAALGQMHKDFAAAYPKWDNRIEVQYLSLAGLRSFRTAVTRMAAISPGDPFHVIEAGKDWLMNWYFVQENGVTLFGPPARTIIAPISKEEFVQSVVDHATQWPEWVAATMNSRHYQGYAILTACRALYTFRNGVQVSKKRAAEWAQHELPQWADLIGNALQWRQQARRAADIDHTATYPETMRFVEYVSDLIQAG